MRRVVLCLCGAASLVSIVLACATGLVTPPDDSLDGGPGVDSGCPQFDNFNRLQEGAPKTIAPKPMMARLPQALLAHPDGGALAVLAHIDRAWAYSFRSGSQGQIQGFRDVVGRIMRGERLGMATDQFNIRWAALSTELSEVLDQMRVGLQVDPKKLANQWVARDDARNYVLFGDPAVRLRTEDMPALA